MGKNAKYMMVIGTCALVFLAVGGYGYYRSRELLRGPEISVAAPSNGESQAVPLITLRGTASNVARLDLDGNPIFTDAAGRFAETLLLSPGYNVLTFRGEDRFGRSTEKRIEVVYDGPARAPSASSTAALNVVINKRAAFPIAAEQSAN